ncbi:MAG: cysteine--tRNA ligase [Desulfobulbaceae bacterium]
MPIQTYNTLSRKKEPLTPLEDGHVKLYVCGITSYDFCHIGHARSALAFDMIVRYLRYRGYTVTYIRNFTDIDDKIINRAAEQGVSAQTLAERYIDEFYVAMDKLGIDRPTLEPRATEHIPEMIELISELISKGLAYPSGSDVYYSVNGFPEYGKLSGRNLDDMQAGARIAINEKKNHPMDFVLWKGSKPGEPTWDSPWGPGRPGWHIECSAMSRKYLGDTFDIHGGGQDLVFPHHENEVAQSEGASGKPFVNTWIHHGFVTIRDEKMSKSLGNFLTIREILAQYHPEVLRFFIFSTHYRNPLDFSEAAMQDAIAGLDRLYGCMAALDALSDSGAVKNATVLASSKDQDRLSTIEQRFQKAMDDDFNTAQAQGILFDAVKIINKVLQHLPPHPHRQDVELLKRSGLLIKKLAGIMGLLREDARTYLTEKKTSLLQDLEISEQEILALIQERKDARAAKEWARGDSIRDQLLARGVELKDDANGTTWEIRR